MIITRTPLRISFVGGGSDRAPGGAVVSVTIDKYVYVTVNEKFDGTIRASYRQTENVADVDELQHELIREGLRLAGLRSGVEVTSVADVPAGTGLGSSSSFTCGLLRGLYAHRGIYASANRIARDACTVEIARCKKQIGCQDQYAAAHGGLNLLTFSDGVDVMPLVLRPDVLRAFHARLLLLHIGGTHDAGAICGSSAPPATTMLADLAHEFAESLRMGDLDSLGDLLNEGWQIKRGSSPHVTTPAIDAALAKARAHGAMGGKLLGAGGGGFLLLYAEPELHAGITSALGLRRMAFAFTERGSEVVWSSE